MKTWLAVFSFALLGSASGEELRIPSSTAYRAPGVTWFGELKAAGKLDCAVLIRLPPGTTVKLRLAVAGQTNEATATGGATNLVRVDFGEFNMATAGYQRFDLEPRDSRVTMLLLDGPAAQAAHFNLLPRKNAASVHLTYPTPGRTNIDGFYCEATGLEDPTSTYYMACGWNRGYFGMQVNSPTERRIIFSVWDSGNESTDRNKVNTDDRVTLVAKGEGVFSGDFGNEGTGGHSHLVYPWKTGEKQRFFVTAKRVDATHMIYSGYYFHPGQNKWMLISSWKAPKATSYLQGLYSFNEDFDGNNGYLRRKARFGNQWFRTTDGVWTEITTASFSHDPTGKADRLDRFMGVEDGEFFLSNGGFIAGSTPFGEKFTRPSASPTHPEMMLPSLPALPQ